VLKIAYYISIMLYFLAAPFSFALIPHHHRAFAHEEFRSTDYPPKFYAQILLAVDTSTAPDYSYLALRIAPDQLALIEYDGTTVNELDVIAVECAQDTWYTATAAFDDGIVTVTCISEAPGMPMATLSGASELLDTLNNETNIVGFTVGELADYHFRALEYVTVPNATINHVEWDYDPYGRKIAQTEYDGSGAVVSQTRYVYDGWQLVQEIDALADTVIAEYVYGPGYIDDVIQSSRGGNTYYHHTDQQYSTVAVTDASGAAVERYTYDAFGNAAFYEGDGTPLTTGSTINNPILYTGRIWQPELGLYDYRNRMYDPATGRFTTPDPLGTHGDWNNMGNAYTYVGNNPGSYLDPLGLETYGSQPYYWEVLETMGGFFIGGPLGMVTGTFQAAIHPINTACGIGCLGYGLCTDFGGTSGAMLSSFDAAISDSDSAGIVAFDIATSLIPASKVTAGAKASKGGSLARGAKSIRGLVDKAGDSRTIRRLADNAGTAINPVAEIANKLKSGKSIVNNPVKNVPKTWNDFQSATKGQYASRAEAAQTWKLHKAEHGIITGTSRSTAQKKAFLKQLKESGKVPKWMNQWLNRGNVPPGYNIDHIIPLFRGDPDVPGNMRLKLIADHTNRHRLLRP
jgi:RHS repeat-associated protein